MNSISRMRTIAETIDEIRQFDNHTAITSNWLRQLCKENKIRHFYTGKKLLLDFDALLVYLNTSVDISLDLSEN